MRWENEAEYDEITEIVKEINRKEVMPEEVLSDSVYFYYCKDDSLSRVAGNDGKEEGQADYSTMQTGLYNSIRFSMAFVKQMCYTLN